MLDLSILTPSAPFPDPAIRQALKDQGGLEQENTIGLEDRIQEIVYSFDPAGQTARYMLEPELGISCILLQGPGHRDLAKRLAQTLDCVDPADAALRYSPQAGEATRIGLLRILSAHALQEFSPAMEAVALAAAKDPSPVVRLGVVQLAQYANHPRMRQILTEVLMPDADPDVQAFAEHVLANWA